MYSEPAVAFHELDDSLWFLCSFFGSQLVGQASHSSLGRVVKRRVDSQGQIVLVGLLSTYWHVMTPAFLLLVTSLYRFPVSVGKVENAVESALRSELTDLEVSPEEIRDVVSTAVAALRKAAIPESLGPFVPNGDSYRLQPDNRIVERLRQGALRALVGAAS